MDYFQGVVQEYLRASRTRFVNSECLIQLDEGSFLAKRAHWYCDFVTVDFGERMVHLCEVSFARESYSLLRRLDAWHANWKRVCRSVLRDCHIPDDWKVGIWVFVPLAMEESLRQRARAFLDAQASIPIRVTGLETILPWKYRSWDGTSYDPAE